MKTQQFLEHHGIRTNPFAEEDAKRTRFSRIFVLPGRIIPLGIRSTAILLNRQRRSCLVKKDQAKRPRACRS